MKLSALWEAYMKAWDSGAPMEGTEPLISEWMEKYKSTRKPDRDRSEYHDKILEDHMVLRWG